MISWSTQRARFIETCRRAVGMGLQRSTGGNLSVRLPEQRFLVKPSGISLHDLREEHLLVVDARGNLVEGDGHPTKELPSHLAIYASVPGVAAVVHYHAPYSTAFAVLGKTIPLLTVHARRTLVSVPVMPPAGEGSPELAAALAEAFGSGTRAALLGGHGMIAAGRDLREAQVIAELLEESAQVAHLAATLASARNGS